MLPALQLLVVQLAFPLLRLRHLAHSLVEVVLVDRVSVVFDGEETATRILAQALKVKVCDDLRFCDNISQIGTVEAVAHFNNALEINLAVCLHASRVNLHDLKTANLVGQRDLNLAVQTSSTQQSRVEGVGSICRHDDLGLSEVVETVQLVQQLHQCTLDLAICRCTLGEPSSTDSVDFVHEDDAGLVLLCVAEHLADETSGLADVLVNDSGGHDCIPLAS